MATARSARAQRAQPHKSLYADSDSGADTEVETPRPVKTSGSRKRLSEHDKSFTEDSLTRTKTVDLNDDAAEKRKRRQSARMPTENAIAGPSSAGAGDGTGDGDENSRSLHARRRQQQLASIATIETPALNPNLDNYEEWMKMAMDGKINATNSWGFALIDYFHDMSLLRNVTDNSINFQRASSTLDGCVKIWTSRVDSVGTETGKLLSNLASGGRGDDDEEPTSDNPDSPDPSQKAKRKAHRHESTLAKNAAQLKIKKLDLEFSVDPLFRKTCADFDEGGAHGLLMNHLSLGVGSEGALRVIFDASDSMGKDGEEDEDEVLEPEDDIDLGVLRNFIPDFNLLESKAIAHSLEDFAFNQNPFPVDDIALFRDDTPKPANEDDGDDGDDFGFGGAPEEFEMDVDAEGPAPEEDFFAGDQGAGDDYSGGSPGGYGGEDGEEGSVGAQAGHGQAMGTGVFVPFDPRRAPNERDLVMAMTDGDGEGGIMGYFNQNFLKNWAGPEHWKLRKPVRRPDAAETGAAKPRREKKEPFKIDFSALSDKDPKERCNELFARATRGAGLTLTKVSARRGSKGKKGKEKRDEHILPDDMHFSSRELVTLFLKPKFSLKMRGQRVIENGDGEVDENFWAQAAADQAAGRAAEDADETGMGGAIPFNTQFFQDDYDDGPGFDDGFDGEVGDVPIDPGEQDLLAATQGHTRRVRPEAVNYTKRAKRVDVRKLKENIWKNLNIIVPEQKEDPDAMDEDEDDGGTDPNEGRVFDSVITGLQDSYPEEKLSEISTSFCFICLLHLANERGLKLETGTDDDISEDNEDGGSQVGNIWSLKVYRDPNAIPAA
ncbi:condensin complex subunit 2/barren [Amylostereum chailletii]|nr:condensin complex subunit 2/barren [Amylostereum chailletii]